MLPFSLLRHRLHRHLLLHNRRLHSVDITDPTFIIYASNTGVGKTLVSTGIANSVLSSSSPSSFLYLKPIQTGFPHDSDSRFVYRKISDLFRRRLNDDPLSVLFASNHAIRASIPAREEILGVGSAEGEEEGAEERGLCSYEENRVGGAESEALRFRLDCKTIFAWKAAVSPHLAVEMEGMEVDDSMLRGMVAKCLESWSADKGKEKKEGSWRVIETAGGVASPGPSGTLQCDLYR